jgi:3-methyl-2-oxobutanoate hydroxymethyltransferase
MLGMNHNFNPRFLRRYANLDTVIHDAVSHYVSDVKELKFPTDQESY